MTDCCDRDSGHGGLLRPRRRTTARSPRPRRRRRRGSTAAWPGPTASTTRRRALLRARGRGRPGVRDGALGDRLRRRPQLQLRLGRLRPGQPELVAVHRAEAREHAERAAPPASAVEQALIATLAARYPGDRGRRGRPRLVRGARRGDANGVPALPGRPRRRRAVRRGSDERDAVADVGPPDRATGRGRPHASRRARSSSAPSRRPRLGSTRASCTCTST